MDDPIERALRSRPPNLPTSLAPLVLSTHGSSNAFGAALTLLVTIGTIGVILGGIGLRVPGGEPGATASDSGVSPATPSPIASTVKPSVPLIDANGIPTGVGGEPVLTGAAITAAVTNATDDHSFLVGGWIHQGRPVCPVSLTNLGPWYCPGIGLYASKSAPDAIDKIPNDPLFRVYIVNLDKYFADLAKTGEVAPFESTRPVVLRIHTHDSTCPAELPGCSSLPALVEVVWVGPAS